MFLDYQISRLCILYTIPLEMFTLLALGTTTIVFDTIFIMLDTSF